MPWRLLLALAALWSVWPGMTSADDQAVENLLVRPAEGFRAPRGYVCYRAAGEMNVDGRLDEAVWKSAAWSEEFVDIEGAVKPQPTWKTRVKMLWDDEYLYIGAELEETHVWGTLTRHDAVIFQDNDFEVFVDPDGDGHNYGELELNVLNTTWDLRLPKPYKDGGMADDAWEIEGLKTATSCDGTINDPADTDRSWTVEIAVPLRSVSNIKPKASEHGQIPRDGEQWRINFSRVEWDVEIVDGQYRKIPGRPEHNWVWSPQYTVNMHRPETWGYIEFRNTRGSVRNSRDATVKKDPMGPIRYQLTRIYYAQQAHRQEHKAYATELTQLELTRLDDDSLAGPIELRTTADGWQAVARIRLGDGRETECRIDQSSRFSIGSD
jgi:hypothetical protein